MSDNTKAVVRIALLGCVLFLIHPLLAIIVGGGVLTLAMAKAINQ
ncbi:hypothetical protein [Flavobacterium columnare]|nr:hypothetical protein [Flavobacterium columnare]